MLAVVTALLEARWRWFAVVTAAVALASPIGAAGGTRTSNIAGRLSAGDDQTCEVTAAGAAMCWGGNTSGELGSAPWPGSKKPVVVTGLSKGVVSIAAGDAYSCALTSSGGVKCWGDNENGALGHPGADGAKPVDVAGLTSGAVAVAVDTGHSCAITSTGGVECWGYNGNGELGDGTHVNRKTPVAVAGLASGVTAIGAGGGTLGDHSCALTTGGGVKCWGYNADGELGDGTHRFRSVPTRVTGLTGGFAAIAVGSYHSCALLESGGIKCWGSNDSGDLGDGTTIDRRTPVDVK